MWENVVAVAGANSNFEAILRSWPFDPQVLFALVLTAIIYLRGWSFLRRRDPERWLPRQPIAFLAGLGCLFLALASPIEPFTSLLLQVHMVQHLLLMMAAPPLLWLGTPLLPLLRGLPAPVRVYWVAPLFRWRWLRALLSRLTGPAHAWLVFVAVTWLWHVPRIYDLALRSDRWHYLEHACFLLAALIFWYPVIRPYPCRLRWSRWLLVPYLILADVQNTALAALFAFSDQPLYAYYRQVPRLGGLSPQEDQAIAGVIMWVPGSLVFLLPLFIIGLQLLFGTQRQHRPRTLGRRIALPITSELPGCTSDVGIRFQRVRESPSASPAFDVLRLPLLGAFLRWRHARLAVQMLVLLLTAATIWDGLTGPQAAPLNLAGVLPWIHWRGLVILGLLVAGNMFCFACPFLVPRTFARWLLPASASWPRPLRNKWPAVVLLAIFLWSYEAFALWDSPWLTAWIAVAYFAAALVIDGVFRGAAFCKYVCPIGQFNFVQSLVSPLEVRVRETSVCRQCSTKDCIRGRDGIPGCELHLFQPRKTGNMDCTFCLDCVHACPHDNVVVGARPPASELWTDPQRSGIGRFSRRPDLAALVLLLVFGAFANAAGMVAPVVAWQEQLSKALGERTPLLATSLFYALSLVLLPLATVSVAAWASRAWSRSQTGWREGTIRYSYSLVPIGFAMWLAHYSFHFATSYPAILPAGWRFTRDAGLTLGADPEWMCNCCAPVSGWLLRAEIFALDLGLLLSLYVGYRIARSLNREVGTALRALAPWALLIVFLFAAGVWIVFQPMEMRGTLQMAG